MADPTYVDEISSTPTLAGSVIVHACGMARGVKMTLRIITKNHEADPEKGFLTKSISKPYDRT